MSSKRRNRKRPRNKNKPADEAVKTPTSGPSEVPHNFIGAAGAKFVERETLEPPASSGKPSPFLPLGGPMSPEAPPLPPPASVAQIPEAERADGPPFQFASQFYARNEASEPIQPQPQDAEFSEAPADPEMAAAAQEAAREFDDEVSLEFEEQAPAAPTASGQNLIEELIAEMRAVGLRLGALENVVGALAETYPARQTTPLTPAVPRSQAQPYGAPIGYGGGVTEGAQTPINEAAQQRAGVLWESILPSARMVKSRTSPFMRVSLADSPPGTGQLLTQRFSQDASLSDLSGVVETGADGVTYFSVRPRAVAGLPPPR